MNAQSDHRERIRDVLYLIWHTPTGFILAYLVCFVVSLAVLLLIGVE